MKRNAPDPQTSRDHVQDHVAKMKTPIGQLTFWYKHRNLARLMTECLMSVCVELPISLSDASRPGTKQAARSQEGREVFHQLQGGLLASLSDEDAMTRFPSFGHIIVTLRLGLSAAWSAIPQPNGAKVIKIAEVKPVFQAQVKDRAYKEMLEQNEIADADLLLEQEEQTVVEIPSPPAAEAPVARRRGRPAGVRKAKEQAA